MTYSSQQPSFRHESDSDFPDGTWAYCSTMGWAMIHRLLAV